MDDPGFRILESVVSPSDCDAILRALAERPGGRAGSRHLMSHPAVDTLANSRGLLKLARDWVGSGAVPYRCTLFEKSGERNWLVVWHQDTTLPLVSRFESADWGPWSRKGQVLYAHAPTWALEQIVALRIHLDPSTSANGPLKVLPGSHREGVLSDDQVFARARQSTPLEAVVAKGGVFVMRPLLIHASSKAQSERPRRVLHVEYAAALDLAPGIRLAKA